GRQVGDAGVPCVVAAVRAARQRVAAVPGGPDARAARAVVVDGAVAAVVARAALRGGRTVHARVGVEVAALDPVADVAVVAVGVDRAGAGAGVLHAAVIGLVT